MGRAIACDLLLQKDTKQIILCDKDTKAIHELPEQNDKRLSIKIVDVRDLSQVEDTFKDVDAAIGAIHYGFNIDFTKVAIKTKTHFCDLGGNSTVVDAQLQLDSEAKKAGISIIPDCGLAPGLVSVLVKWGVEKFSWIDTVKICVGGLPVNPQNELKYERLFSLDGLINEYVEPVRVLRNSEIKIVEPLTEIEEVEFKSFGKLEAFTTSGGVSTLVDTYKGRLRNLDYKTIRYQGHCNAIKALQKDNLFSKEYFEKNLPLCTNDVVLVKIIFLGSSIGHELTIIEKAKPHFTAMMRTTAFPASIISQMQARGQIKEIGVQPQERCVPVDIFISELSKRGIFIQGIQSFY